MVRDVTTTMGDAATTTTAMTTTATATTTTTTATTTTTKFAAPHPFPDPKVKTSVRAILPRPANSAAKQPAPASLSKPTSDRDLDIGKYDGGFKTENEKRGEAVDGEAAEELALDSSVSR